MAKLCELDSIILEWEKDIQNGTDFKRYSWVQVDKVENWASPKTRHGSCSKRAHTCLFLLVKPKINGLSTKSTEERHDIACQEKSQVSHGKCRLFPFGFECEIHL